MRKEFLKCIATSLVLFLIAALLLVYFTPQDKEGMPVLPVIVSNYHANIRGYMFSGFLSIGTFMFSLMTFVITNLKEKLFDTEYYLKHTINKMRKEERRVVSEDEIKCSNFYSPLKKLCTFISFAIGLALATSFLQFTLGFSNNIFAIGFCGYLGILTLCFLAKSLWFMWRNLQDWLSVDVKIRDIIDKKK